MNGKIAFAVTFAVAGMMAVEAQAPPSAAATLKGAYSF